MSVSSMTGFARTDGATVFEKKRCDWFFELKSVNGKSLDVKTKLPFRLESLSMFVKNKANIFPAAVSAFIWKPALTAKPA